ncbi:MAG: diaminopimelate epimerase, partial [Planctomycetota bacterium]
AAALATSCSGIGRRPGSMAFTKMQGAGNDFVCLDVGDTGSPADPSALARALCDRRTGIGADGLLLIGPSREADARMILINADGSRAEMCGNGIRCVGKYLHDRGRARGGEVRIETDSGVKTLRLHVEAGRAVAATVDLGPPALLPDRLAVPVAPPGVPPRTFEGDRLSMGNPHFVVFLEEDLAAFPVEAYGPAIERHALFPDRTNVEFVRLRGRGEIDQRTWERGAGETLACGTGACASAVAAIRRGHAEGEVRVRLRGGELRIEWDGRGPVYLTGPAVESFAGEWASPRSRE